MSDDIGGDEGKAAYHLERAYLAATAAWGAAVKTGNRLAIETAQESLNAIKQAQCHLPRVAAPGLTADAFDLSDLAVMRDLGPDFTELRGRLGQALDIAERIDQARGRSYPEKIGGSCGWDLAEEVSQLLARVELAAEGAPGKGLE